MTKRSPFKYFKTSCCDPRRSSGWDQSPWLNLARLRRRSNGRSAQQFRCAKLIAHCCELGGKDRRGLIAEGRMRPLGVVDVGPASHGLTGMVDAEEQGLVQKLIAHAAVESLAVAILHGLAGGDVVPLHPHRLRPFQDRV